MRVTSALERHFRFPLPFIYDRAKVIMALIKPLCQTECAYALISYTTDTCAKLKKFKTEELCESGKSRPTPNLRLGYAGTQEGC